ncbi:hypothetical protein AVEN_188991-1 [Araneus ventricosus]|uniref:Uncharacterized protein n=1 Tax=Araneus ventricosus TaxID=182803 RepID=A0A4Y2JMW7_ARAVE|nr:hypothetical protein AVEN_188991-1 [Araneus ventricosus]
MVPRLRPPLLSDFTSSKACRKRSLTNAWLSPLLTGPMLESRLRDQMVAGSRTDSTVDPTVYAGLVRIKPVEVKRSPPGVLWRRIHFYPLDQWFPTHGPLVGLGWSINGPRNVSEESKSGELQVSSLVSAL